MTYRPLPDRLCISDVERSPERDRKRSPERKQLTLSRKQARAAKRARLGV